MWPLGLSVLMKEVWPFCFGHNEGGVTLVAVSTNIRRVALVPVSPNEGDVVFVSQS